jgi:hypothetical protein
MNKIAPDHLTRSAFAASFCGVEALQEALAALWQSPRFLTFRDPFVSEANFLDRLRRGLISGKL